MPVIWGLLFWLLLTATAWAQSSLDKYIGKAAGEQLGHEAYLFQQAYPRRYKMRLGILPWFSSVSHEAQQKAEQHWQQISTSLHDFEVKQIMPEHNKKYPYTRMVWKELALQHATDVFLQISIQNKTENYWLNFQLIEGISGKIIKNNSLIIKDFKDYFYISQQITSFLEKIISEYFFQIKDIGLETDTGALFLETTPEKMRVELDGVPVGFTPLMLRHVSPGIHTLKLSEFRDYQYQLLRISSIPSDQAIYLNRSFLGKTPVNLPAELLKTPGVYQFDFPEIRSLEANLEILTRPEGVPFRWDQNLLQRSPVVFQEIGSGRHQLQVFSSDAASIEQKIQIESGKILDLKINAYKFAKVIIDASEQNAEVVIDGENKGQTALSLNLSQGIHHMMVRKPRFKAVTSTLELEAGRNYNFLLTLEPKSVDTSIFLTPTAEMSHHFNFSSKLFGLSSLTTYNSALPAGVSLASLEVDYGWPQLMKAYSFLDLGVSAGIYSALLQKGRQFSLLNGVGTKVQLLKEGPSVPVSFALGGYLNLESDQVKPVGFMSLSRNFFDFALHLGLQTHGMNLNIGYTGFDNLKLGLVVFANSFWGLLTASGEEMTTLYGLQAGYRF
jgi:hypothetical protein